MEASVPSDDFGHSMVTSSGDQLSREAVRLLGRGNFSAEAGKVPSGKPGGVRTHFQWLLLGFEFPGPPESPRRDLLMAK